MNALPNHILINPLVRKLETFLTERGESVFMKVTVKQLLFDGWPLTPYIEL